MSSALNRMARTSIGPITNSSQHRETVVSALDIPAKTAPSSVRSAALFSATPYALLLRVQRRVAVWRERSQSRHDLARLMPGMYLELLAQGLDVDNEARKPFWRT